MTIDMKDGVTACRVFKESYGAIRSDRTSSVRRSRLTLALLAAILASLSTSEVRAWDPPDGPTSDQVTPPATPTTLVTKTHGVIIQQGISVLYNDGFWFAAQTLRTNQQELLNGVRYADEYAGLQTVGIQICEFFGVNCNTIKNLKSWPYGADNHYFNPDTSEGLQAGYLQDAATWGPVLVELGFLGLTGDLAYSTVDVVPALASEYPSALAWFTTEYGHAIASTGAPSINGRQGTALSMFYMGWASHLMQDQSVVHHTFDEVLENHAEYESAADSIVQTLPLPLKGTYAQSEALGTGTLAIPSGYCTLNPITSRTCFAEFAARITHSSVDLNAISNGTFAPSIDVQIPFIESLQAGLYYAYLEDIGQRPVHMSAVMPGLTIY